MVTMKMCIDPSLLGVQVEHGKYAASQLSPKRAKQRKIRTGRDQEYENCRRQDGLVKVDSLHVTKIQMVTSYRELQQTWDCRRRYSGAHRRRGIAPKGSDGRLVEGGKIMHIGPRHTAETLQDWAVPGGDDPCPPLSSHLICPLFSGSLARSYCSCLTPIYACNYHEPNHVPCLQQFAPAEQSTSQ